MRPKIRLQPDDRKLVRLLSDPFLLLSEKQILELFGGRPERSVTRRLSELEAAGIVNVREIDDFFGDAKDPFYYIGSEGVKIEEAASKNPKIQDRIRQARKVRDGALAHLRFANWIHIKFGTARRTYEDYELVSWIPQYAPLWNVLNEHGLSIQPDGYAHYRKGGRDFHVFLEADRGSYWGEREQRRLEGYQRYAASGRFREHFSGDAFRVLLITEKPRRAKNLVRATSRYGDDVFWVSAREDFFRKGLFEPYWRSHSSDVTHSLDETPGRVAEPPAPPGSNGDKVEKASTVR